MPAFYFSIVLAQLVVAASAASVVSLPPPTGPFNVGTKSYVLKHTTYNDHVSPTNVTRSILVNIYYPTHEQAPLQKYVWEGLSATYDSYYGLPRGTFSNITANIAFNGKPLSNKEQENLKLPTLFFGPAMAGPPTQLFTGLIAEMASRGYPVVAIDHPYEQPYIEYPNGTSFLGHPVDWNPCTPDIEAVHSYRLTDNTAALDALPQISQTLGIPLDLRRFAFFGHSLGGSAAASQIILETKRPKSRGRKSIGAINMDGQFFGPAATNSSDINIRVPSLLLGSSFRDPKLGYDPTWPLFEHFQTSWTKSLRIMGRSNHTDYSDLIFLKQANGIAGGNGVISAARFLEVSRILVANFFGMLVGRGEGILSGTDQVKEMFPEVIFDYNGKGESCDPAPICWKRPPLSC